MIRELFLRDLSLWDCLWQSTAFLALGLTTGRLLRRHPSRAYEALLFAMVAAALVPFLSAVVRHCDLGAFAGRPETPAYRLPDPPAPAAPDVADPEPVTDVAPPFAGPASEHSPAMMADIPWRTIFLSAWLAATLVLLGRLGATFLYGAHLVRRAGGPGCERIQQAAERTAARFRPAGGLQIRASARIRSPVVWCWTRPPVLLVPPALGRRDIDWTGVVAHELAHYRRCDHLTGLLAELTVGLLPWNPLMWVSRRVLIRLGEQACDDWVVAMGQPGEDYAESLLRFRPQRQMAFWPAVVSSRTGLSHRIRRILSDACANPRAGVRWALTLSLIATCLAVGVAFAQTRPVPPEAPAKQEEKPAPSLHQAAKEGDLEQVKKLIAQGTDVNGTEGSDKSTPLHAAASGGHAQVVKVLLEAGAKADAGDSHGYTALFFALWSDDEQTVRNLISAGANVNVHPREGDYAPLYYAVWQDHPGIAKVLLDAGANMNEEDAQGWMPLDYAAAGDGSKAEIVRLLAHTDAKLPMLHKAALQGNLVEVESLLAGGADLNQKDRFDRTALCWALAAAHDQVADFLLSKGADIQVRMPKGHTLLHLASRIGLPRIVDILTAGGIPVNAVTEYGTTPLHQAALAGHRAIGAMLIAKGAGINQKDKYGRTPLFYGATGGHVEVVELLLQKGANVNARDNQGRTALRQARERGHAEVIQLLRQHGATESLHEVMGAGDIDLLRQAIAQGADVNARAGSSQTPLHVAVSTGRKDIVELLIAGGADINARSNTWGTTPLIAALRSGHEDIAKLLIAKGADVHARGRGDYTPLHLAATNRTRMTGSLEIMELLLAKGADIEARQEHGATPLACATYDGNTETTKFLLEHGANIEAKLNDGETTPLLRAVSQEYVETARLLLDKGANIHAAWRRLTAVHVAMMGDKLSRRKSDPEMVKLLVARGLELPPTHMAAYLGDLEKVKSGIADATRIDAKDLAAYTALHCAVCGDHADVARFLLDKGADVNAKTTNGWTPLRFAWTVDMAAFLIAHGADVKIADERGTTLLHGAVNQNEHKGDKALIELLLKHGADINARAASTSVGWAGWTTFHVACRNGNPDIVELLLARGADVKAKTDKGETPLAVAQSNEQGRIVSLLRGRGVQE